MTATVRMTIWTVMLIALAWLLFLVCAVLAMRHFYAQLSPVIGMEQAMLGGSARWAAGNGDPRTMLVMAILLWAVVLGCAVALCRVADTRRAHR